MDFYDNNKEEVPSKRRGLIHVYYGDGKGKTSIALGIALRAVGHNMKVYMVQFMKSANTGELFAVEKYIPNFKIVQFGYEAMKEKQLRIFEFNGDKEIKEEYDEKFRFLPDDLEKEAAKEGLVHASKILQQDYDVVILDEINYVMSKGLVDVNKVIDIIKQRNPKTGLIKGISKSIAMSVRRIIAIISTISTNHFLGTKLNFMIFLNIFLLQFQSYFIH